MRDAAAPTVAGGHRRARGGTARTTLALLCSAAAPEPAQKLRVCTFGGDGVCSNGLGEQTLSTLQFLAPLSGLAVTSCSCLARCDRGVAVQEVSSGQFGERVNDPRSCARLLKRLGYKVDQRLPEAFEEVLRGDALANEAREPEALQAYNTAFGLATDAGLGIRWRSRPSSVVRVRLSEDAQAASMGNRTAPAGRGRRNEVTPAQASQICRRRALGSSFADRHPSPSPVTVSRG
eukprot:5311162-Prymnesium_polylepis.1